MGFFSGWHKWVLNLNILIEMKDKYHFVLPDVKRSVMGSFCALSGRPICKAFILLRSGSSLLYLYSLIWFDSFPLFLFLLFKSIHLIVVRVHFDTTASRERLVQCVGDRETKKTLRGRRNLWKFFSLLEED